MSDEINRSLGRIEGKQDMTLGMISEIKEKMDAHGERINSLEKSRVAAMAGAGAVGGVFGFLGSTGFGKALATIIGSH